MKKILLLLIFTLTLINASSKEVLLLHSYHKGYKWSDDISKAIEDKFAPHENIELTTMYMDTKRILGPIYLQKLANLYKEQLSDRNFDLIIVSDNNAFEFIIRYHEYLFPKIPVLFCGINNFDKALLDENNMKEHSSGVVEQVDLEKNFQLISKLHPDMKNLIIINDRSKTGYAVKRDLRPIIEKYKNKFNIEYIDKMEIEKLKEKVSTLDKNDVLLFVLLFKDTTGKYFTYKQSFKQIRNVSKNPIYGLWDFYLNYGIVGGLLTSAIAQGDSVSDMALQILNYGRSVKDIPILENSPNKYIFDYNEVNRFDIPLDDYLSKYELINEPKTIYKEHTKFVILSVLIIFILSVILLSMKANIQRRKIVENELSNQLKFEKVLLDTLPNAIYYKNRDGKLLGSNQAFCDLFNVEKKDVIGKTAFDFFPKDIAQKNIEIDKKILKDQITDTAEITLHFSNLQMKYFILKKSAYEDIDGNIGGIVCIMDDITQRVQQKQFLIQQSKLAEMGDMVAAIAHQWNEPLVELSALIQDMQTSYLLEELQTKDVEEFVNDSIVQIKYMSQTLSDFRNFLKPSTTKTHFSIKQSFDDIFEIIGKQLFYSNIDLQTIYEEDDEYIIYGYKNEFKQVLLNILNNAKNKITEIDDSSKNSVKINIFKNNGYNIIQISDNASEIDENIIHSIFDPYFTTKKEGTGIGLYMAKVIIEDKMQGQIFAKNDEGNAVFTIKMPLNKK